MRMLVKAARILMVAAVIGGAVLAASGAIGNGGPYKNIPVASYLANGAYNIQGDGKNVNGAGASAYYDGIDNVDSILNANTYNRMPIGDWQLTMLSSPTRSVRVNLSGAGVAGAYTAPDLLNHGTGLPARLIENCTKVLKDITAMTVGETMPCPAWFRFETGDPNLAYGLSLNSDLGFGVNDISIYCVSNGGNGRCNYWTFDPPAGGTAVAQLQQIVTTRKGATSTPIGYFNITFHFEVDERQSNP